MSPISTKPMPQEACNRTYVCHQTYHARLTQGKLTALRHQTSHPNLLCSHPSLLPVPQWSLARRQPLCFAQLLGTHNSAISLTEGYGMHDDIFTSYLWYLGVVSRPDAAPTSASQSQFMCARKLLAALCCCLHTAAASACNAHCPPRCTYLSSSTSRLQYRTKLLLHLPICSLPPHGCTSCPPARRQARGDQQPGAVPHRPAAHGGALRGAGRALGQGGSSNGRITFIIALHAEARAPNTDHSHSMI